VPELFHCPLGHRWEVSPPGDPNQTTDLQVRCPVCDSVGEPLPLEPGPAAGDPPSEAETMAPLPALGLDSSGPAPPSGNGAATPAAPAAPGSPSIPGYEILGRVGEGGMGQVYKARHVRLDRVVALKVIHPERLGSPDAVRRFYREARAAARLLHPNLITVYDVDEAGGIHFLAMEYVDGVDLGRLVRDRGPLPVARACEYARQAAEGLQHAHERGLVHRDVKPANLLLTADGRQVKILDLGLARLDAAAPAGEGTSELTQSGTLMGTPAFLAPEQARDAHRADIRSDLYSLGCTLYYLLTGRQPFPGQSLAEVIVQHQLDEPEPVTRLRPDVPVGVDAVLRRTMAKRPEDRYQTPAELAAALAPFCAAPASDPTLFLPRPAPPLGPDPATLRYAEPSLRLRRLPPLDPGRAKRRRLLLAGAVLLVPLLCCSGVGTMKVLFFDRPPGMTGAFKSVAPSTGTARHATAPGRPADPGGERGERRTEMRLKRVEIDPEEQAALLHRRASSYGPKEFDRSIADLSESIKLNRERAGAYRDRGRAYCERGFARNSRPDFAKAVDDFTRAIDLEPNSSALYNFRQWAHLLQGDTDAALADINEALRLRPDDPTYLSNRGEVYLARGDTETALADLNKAIEKNPRLSDAYANRGAVYNERGEYDKALADLDRAVKLGHPPANYLPTRNSVYESRGYAHLRKGELDPALADLDAAIQVNPNSARAYLLRCEVHARKGDKDRAEADLAEARRRDPRLPKEKRPKDQGS
jgi:serine/threonine protein kinase/Tfp pilus assembly protein PilF